MTGLHEPGLDDLPPEMGLKVHDVCTRFESAWRSGTRPDIAEYLRDVPQEARPALLRELILLDIDYRRRRGDSPSGDDYSTLFAAGLPNWLARATASDRAGRYRLGGELGRGGMGVVYWAEDPDLDRELAVKVLSAAGRDNPAVRSRFVREARVTARLQHPNIPPVHEHGELPDGRPFFAMKLVRGSTLRDLLSEPPAGFGLPDLLRVFAQVCQGMGYAHSRGVLHRDLKPANVMVGEFGEVQVMDWGLAKVLSGAPRAAHGEADERTDDPADPLTTIPLGGGPSGAEDVTRDGAVMGTLSFLPPEQARGEIDALDRRSDVFSLGAMLCQILTGQPPYTGPNAPAILARAQAADLADAWDRLDGCGADPELVLLCKECLAADRDARPADAVAVAARVAAYQAAVDERLKQAELDRVRLEGERARSELRAAEQRKRRTVLTAAAAVVFAALVAGTAVSLWQASEAKAAAETALHREREAKAALIAAREAEAKERDAKEATSEYALFLREVLGGTGVVGTGGQKLNVSRTVKRAVDEAVPRIAVRFRGRPKIEAAVRSAVGSAYYSLGAFADAEAQFALAFKLYAQEYTPRHQYSYMALNDLASVLHILGDKDAVGLHRVALAGLEDTAGPDHSDTLRCADNLAGALLDQGALVEAEALFRRALTGFEKAQGANAPDALRAANDYGLLLKKKGDLAGAEALLARARQGFEGHYGPLDVQAMAAASNLSDVFRARGNTAAAEGLRRELLKREEQIYGAEHEYTLATAFNLGRMIYEDRQGYADAVPLFERAYHGFEAKQRQASDPRFAQMRMLDALASRSMLGLSLLRLGKPADAKSHLFESYRGYSKQATLSDPHRNRLRWVTAGLVEACAATGAADEAKQWRAELAKLPPEVAPPPREKK
jgi:tetratricopeptide (TPR) repeat protein